MPMSQSLPDVHTGKSDKLTSERQLPPCADCCCRCSCVQGEGGGLMSEMRKLLYQLCIIYTTEHKNVGT